MPTPQQSRAALQIVGQSAVAAGDELYSRLNGSPELRRAALLETLPGIIDYYADGTAALAADMYDEQRAIAAVAVAYSATPVVADRTVKVRRAIAWASGPMFDDQDPRPRLAEVIQFETARPFRDTITSNRRSDPAAVGWRRVTNNCCKFCTMLGDRGAVYKEATARFAAHPHCDCGAEPVFDGQAVGPEASVMQYIASRKNRTPQQKAALREYLNNFY